MHTLVDTPDPWYSWYFSIETPPPRQTIPCGKSWLSPSAALVQIFTVLLIIFWFMNSNLPAPVSVFWIVLSILNAQWTPVCLQDPFTISLSRGRLPKCLGWIFLLFLRHFRPCSEFAITSPACELPRDTFDYHCCLKPSLVPDTRQSFKRVEERQFARFMNIVLDIDCVAWSGLTVGQCR